MFQIVSDIHFEMYGLTFVDFIDNCPKTADNIIIAGDLCAKKDFIQSIHKFSELYDHVVFVPGNHDYYGYSIPYMNDFFKSQTSDRVHILIDDEVTIDGVKIAGSPLWFSKSKNPIIESDIRNGINDFNYIKDFEKDVYEANSKSIEFLRSTDAEMIVTHFMPTRKSIHPRYFGDNINDYFVCDILDRYPISPKVWIHGHTHDSFDYDYDGIRVVCNPFGYSGSNEYFTGECYA